MKATTTIIIDTRKPLKNGKSPVKLRITYNRKQKYYPADLSLTSAEFDMVRGKNPKADFKKLKLKLDALEQKANKIIDELPVFDFALFSKKLYSDQQVRNDVYAYYSEMINSFKQKGSFGTASNYTCSMESLRKFKSKLTFIDITVEFLDAYENWLISNGKSISTVGIYLRPLRSVINSAIADEVLSKDYNYPFGSKNKHKYQIPTGKNTKKALTLAEIKLLFNYISDIGSWEEKALDFWIFSYLANGMNMKDIANLRYKDIDGEYIKFVRAKTKYTNNVVTSITIFKTPELNNIINKWGNPDRKKENLIFPILNLEDSLERQRAVLKQFTKLVNKYMGGIAKKVGIDKPCTTYYARHSFSTVLKRSGANVQFISEALGHSSINTTKAYLDSFEDDTKKEMAKALTAFN
jgi:integrase/recombinase XerD